MQNNIIELKYCLYARKSSEQDERQAMSIDSQLKEMLELAKREGLIIVETKQESHSAKQSGCRPVFNELINDLRSKKFNGILTWAPDRLSRNAGDLGSLVDLMDGDLLNNIRTFSQSFSNTPNEKFLLMILCSQAKLENDNRGVNVKRGIRAKCEMGWRPCRPPIGYFNRAGAITGLRDTAIDPERAPAVIEMFNMSADGKSGRHIQKWLRISGIKTRSGADITLSQIYCMLKNPFYYGIFEYPKKSGKWYDGKHEPLISKGLFDKVQKQLIVPQKSKWGAKEFPFRRFLTCASCGSQIVGEEKFKPRADGGKNRHVYYHCSRQVNYKCPEPYVKEEIIIQELTKLSKSIIIQQNNVEPGLSEAIERYLMMVKSTHKTSQAEAIDGYIKYVLRNGTDFERSRLIHNINKNFAVHNRKIIEFKNN